MQTLEEFLEPPAKQAESYVQSSGDYNFHACTHRPIRDL